jgi:hypothetical protein
MRIKIRVDKTILGKIWKFNYDNGLFAFNNKINFINIIVPSYVGFLPSELLICLQNWHGRHVSHYNLHFWPCEVGHP